MGGVAVSGVAICGVAIGGVAIGGVAIGVSPAMCKHTTGGFHRQIILYMIFLTCLEVIVS